MDLLTKDKHQVIDTWIATLPANEIQLVQIVLFFFCNKDLLHFRNISNLVESILDFSVREKRKSNQIKFW